MEGEQQNSPCPAGHSAPLFLCPGLPAACGPPNAGFRDPTSSTHLPSPTTITPRSPATSSFAQPDPGGPSADHKPRVSTDCGTPTLLVSQSRGQVVRRYAIWHLSSCFFLPQQAGTGPINNLTDEEWSSFSYAWSPQTHLLERRIPFPSVEGYS